jgi:hypothetical protein
VSRDLQQYRSGRASTPVRTGITYREATELRRLYAELPDAAAAARMALKMATRIPMTGEPLARFLATDRRIVEIINRIQAILGTAM